MLIFKRIKDIENQLKRLKNAGNSVGFVPTMGALHAGHISLLLNSKKACDVTVCSIFVNPTQFNDKADFDKYPDTIEKDIEKLSDADCDILFLPTTGEMYPGGFEEKAALDFGFIAETLEGEHRPGHFKGVAQIVIKLLRIVKPDKLFMGQKDYQQQLIVRQLIKMKRLKTVLVTCPTKREKDGLAMSSRNARLDGPSRILALQLSKTLKQTKSKLRSPSRKSFPGIQAIEMSAISRLSGIRGIVLEYFAIRNAQTLRPVKARTEKLVALVAVKTGGVRLIDNMLLN